MRQQFPRCNWISIRTFIRGERNPKMPGQSHQRSHVGRYMFKHLTCCCTFIRSLPSIPTSSTGMLNEQRIVNQIMVCGRGGGKLEYKLVACARWRNTRWIGRVSVIIKPVHQQNFTFPTFDSIHIPQECQACLSVRAPRMIGLHH